MLVSFNYVKYNNTNCCCFVCVFQAAVDKMKNGSCPTCHRYFLIFYILRERGLVDLVVTTFIPENPPKEVLDFSNGKRYPLVKVHKGVDTNGQDMSGIECETIDEIEQLVERFECDDMYGRRDSKMESKAELTFENLYMVSNMVTIMGCVYLVFHFRQFHLKC